MTIKNEFVPNKKDVVNSFNDDLVREGVVIRIDDYTRLVAAKHYADEFDMRRLDHMSGLLVGSSGEPTIRHNELIDCGVLNKGSDSSHVKDLVESYCFVRGADYIVVQEKRGRANAVVYLFTAKAFVKCLLRAKGTKQYINMYVFLFDCVFEHYSSYQLKMERRAFDEHMNGMTQQLGQLSVQVQDRTERLIEATHRQVMPTSNRGDNNCFMILERKNYNVKLKHRYYVIRSTIENCMKSVEKEQARHASVVRNVFHYVPNAIVFWKTIKEELEPLGRIVTRGSNEFSILESATYGYAEFLADVQRIYNRRNEITVPI